MWRLNLPSNFSVRCFRIFNFNSCAHVKNKLRFSLNLWEVIISELQLKFLKKGGRVMQSSCKSVWRWIVPFWWVIEQLTQYDTVMNRIMNRVIQFSSFNLPHYTCLVSRKITFIAVCALQAQDFPFLSCYKGSNDHIKISPLIFRHMQTNV